MCRAALPALFVSLQAAKAKQPHKAVELFEAMSTSGVQVCGRSCVTATAAGRCCVKLQPGLCFAAAPCCRRHCCCT